jgi:4-hydroxyisophthalate hydroxylase
LGPGFTLIAVGASDESAAAFVAAADSSGVPLDVVTREAGSEAEEYGSCLILVRPDHFVSWVGDGADPATAGEVLARSAGR